MNKNLRIVIALSLLTVLACEPVIAIGWNEFLIVFIAVAVLLGPPLYRFIRRVDEFRKRMKKDK